MILLVILGVIFHGAIVARVVCDGVNTYFLDFCVFWGLCVVLIVFDSYLLFLYEFCGSRSSGYMCSCGF